MNALAHSSFQTYLSYHILSLLVLALTCVGSVTTSKRLFFSLVMMIRPTAGCKTSSTLGAAFQQHKGIRLVFTRRCMFIL
jgi:hypothetical protein